VKKAFKILGPYLWEVEKREIFEYKTIYFFIYRRKKKIKAFRLNKYDDRKSI